MPAKRSSPRQTITSATVTLTSPLTPETILEYFATNPRHQDMLKDIQETRDGWWAWRWFGRCVCLYLFYKQSGNIWTSGWSGMEYTMRWMLGWALIDIYLGYRWKESEKGAREAWAQEMKKRAMRSKMVTETETGTETGTETE